MRTSPIGRRAAYRRRVYRPRHAAAASFNAPILVIGDLSDRKPTIESLRRTRALRMLYRRRGRLFTIIGVRIAEVAYAHTNVCRANTTLRMSMRCNVAKMGKNRPSAARLRRSSPLGLSAYQQISCCSAFSRLPVTCGANTMEGGGL